MNLVTLIPDIPMFLQLCAIDDNNKLNITTVDGWPFRYENMFDAPGEYLFKVSIGSDATIWKSYQTKLHWTGNWQTSTMEPI